MIVHRYVLRGRQISRYHIDTTRQLYKLYKSVAKVAKLMRICRRTVVKILDMGLAKAGKIEVTKKLKGHANSVLRDLPRWLLLAPPGNEIILHEGAVNDGVGLDSKLKRLSNFLSFAEQRGEIELLTVPRLDGGVRYVAKKL